MTLPTLTSNLDIAGISSPSFLAGAFAFFGSLV